MADRTENRAGEAEQNVDPTLLWILRRCGDDWGPLGVALAAAHLSDPAAVVRRLSEDAQQDHLGEPPRG